jgi:hypothetical protein
MSFASEVFAEIANWRQEAWSEPTERYFFSMSEADQLISGRKSFVVSRKGTGKSALAKHLLMSSRQQQSAGRSNEQFASQLSLKDFPYESFRKEMANVEEQDSHQFQLGWEYVKALGLGTQRLEKVFGDRAHAVRTQLKSMPQLVGAAGFEPKTTL